MLAAALNVVVLAYATVLLTALAERLAGGEAEERWSLPLANMLLVTVVGQALFLRWSWAATGSLLGVYAAVLFGAALCRRAASREAEPGRERGGPPAARQPVPRLIGYWIESVSENDPCVPQELVGELPDRVRKRVAAYLSRGHERHAELGYSWCRFGCGIADKRMGCRELGDGPWAWPEGLAHYVLEHGVMLPEEFIEHALTRSGLRGLFAGAAKIAHDDEQAVDARFWRDWCGRRRSGAFREALARGRSEARRLVEARRDAAAQKTAERRGVTDQECVKSGCQGKALVGSAYCARCAPDTDALEPLEDARTTLLSILNSRWTR